MIKSAKKNAKNLIFSKFKYLLIPSTIIMLFNAIAYLFINVIITYMYWGNFSPLLQMIFLLCFMGLEFVCIPLSSVVVFKTIINLDNTSEANAILSMKQMFSYDIVLKTVKLNFLPRLLHILVQACSTKVFYYNRNYSWVAIIASWVGIFISYKFFAGDYFIALEKEHPIKSSFRLMKNNFWEYLLLGLSFIGYAMLGGAIGVILQYLITGNVSYNLYFPQLRMFNSFGYGVGFFLTPYIFTSKYFWFKQKDVNKKQDKNDQSESSKE